MIKGICLSYDFEVKGHGHNAVISENGRQSWYGFYISQIIYIS